MSGKVPLTIAYGAEMIRAAAKVCRVVKKDYALKSRCYEEA